MKFSLRHWGPRQLLLSWGAYWIALGLTTLRPALALLARLGRAGAHGQASAGWGDGLVTLTITNGDGSAWAGAIRLSSLVLWLFGPPLLLWIVWAVTRPRRDGATSDEVAAGRSGVAPARALYESPYPTPTKARDRVAPLHDDPRDQR